jgi:hypothetical protein
MTTIRGSLKGLLKAATTLGFGALLLLFTGPAASARVVPDPYGPPPVPTGVNPAPASGGSGGSGASGWQIALPAVSALVAIALTLLVIRLVIARRSAAGHTATS